MPTDTTAGNHFSNQGKPPETKLTFASFRIKLMLVLALSMLLLVALSGFLLSKQALDGQRQELRSQLSTIAQMAALSVDARLLTQIPLHRAGTHTHAYKQTEKHLKEIFQASPTISDLYILTRTDEEGIWQFVVDIDTPNSSKGKPGAAYPGDRYHAARFPQMMKGYQGPASDESVEKDEWGATLSGYAPIKDDHGDTIALIGVDIAADVLVETERTIRQTVWLMLFIGLVLSIFPGFWLASRISRRISRLVQGTHHLARGDLRYRTDIRGRDEIGQLAEAFNRMAGRLEQARRELNDYFIRIVQSLVLSLEAKDAYTAGHSERVAEYAAQTAAAIGLAAEEIEALKEAALLHDIGKLGIRENILNKNGPLSPEEREDINSHPARGGRILEPVGLNNDMLSVVTEHHEHYDGTGYPRGLAGEQINLWARITAVADAYDAMTSSRAYRQALGRELAIRELERSKGTQLDPRLVDAFIGTLQKASTKITPLPAG